MSRICAVCGKRPQVSFLVSHARNRLKRWVYPNVHTMRFVMADDSRQKVYRGKVCTKCMKAGKVRKII